MLSWSREALSGIACKFRANQNQDTRHYNILYHNNLEYILDYKIIDQDFACIMFTLHILHACYLHCCTCVYCRARPKLQFHFFNCSLKGAGR